MEIPYASIKDYLESNTVTLTAKVVGVTNPTTFTVTYGAVNENGHDLPIQTDKIGDNYGNAVTDMRGRSAQSILHQHDQPVRCGWF